MAQLTLQHSQLVAINSVILLTKLLPTLRTGERGILTEQSLQYIFYSLYLNVWAPANATNTSSLPVKVWIYGGAGYIGTSADPLNNGCGIATNAIVVSMNYRLGPLGWLTLGPPVNFTGNYGVLDILMALQWVQENIASFGGNNV
jgi:acetyl esterase/lipase